MNRRNESTQRRQRGAALLMIMLVILVAAGSLFVAQISSNELRLRQASKTQTALAVARQALLGYAAVQPDLVFGQAVTLPCPDVDDSMGLLEGEAHTSSCGPAGVTVMGRLPWRTLGVEPPSDGSGECLWYVVSGTWKDADLGTAALINPDSNGQLQLWGVEAGAVVQGTLAEDRIVAMVIAPMQALAGQTRTIAANRQCSVSFAAANFLDNDALSGINNATLNAAVDGVDILAMVAGTDEAHNDQIATISRADIERVTTDRPGFENSMRSFGLAVAACVADYGKRNSGGGNDRRLPWPATLQLADYRPDASYNDVNTAVISGRLPDIVDDSNVLTANTTTSLLSACNTVSVPQWSVGMLQMWRHWKDHLFYIVAESHAPNASTPSTCTNCITVNGSGQYVGVVLFASSRLEALAQLRNAPPTDIDTRDDINNYLEAVNAGAFPYSGGGLDLISQATSNTFNDLLFCIDDSLGVSEC